jgi:hypothetical protein
MQWRTQSYRTQADALLHELQLRYQQENHLLTQHSTKEDRQAALKDAILIQHEYYLQCETGWLVQQSKRYQCYPFIRYKRLVNHDIARLKKIFVRISGCDDMQAQDILHQLQQLEILLTLIVTLDAYQEEEKNWQRDKQQEELNTLLHKQNEYLKEQNNLLKKQKKEFDVPTDSGTIITAPYPTYSNAINPPARMP